MRFGSYESIVEIGRGGLGMVFRCRGPDGIDVAVKVLRAASSDQLARFERERRLLAELGEQEGFVGLIDAGTSAGGPWIAMPFCRGGTLRDRIAQGPLSIDGTVALGIRLASALGLAHARGIVHRDMKPENVLFRVPGGPPLIADLGLAKHFDRGQPGATQSVVVTLKGTMLGTAGYMSPEQGGGAEAAGPPADVFALGAILHECLTGRPVYKSDNLLMLLTKVMGGDREPLDRPGVAPWLEAAIEKALSTDPDERFADGQEFAEALRLGPRGLTVPAGEQKPVERKRRVFAPLVAVGIVLALSAGAVVAITGLAAPKETAPPAVLPAVIRSRTNPVVPALPSGLRVGSNVTQRNGSQVYLWRLPGDADDMELVHVPAGDFIMGTDDPESYDWERPRHSHESPHEYWIGRYDVTWGQYLLFCKATNRREPNRPPFWSQLREPNDHPVVNVSSEDAAAFCTWAGVSLPSEAEWEKAARGAHGHVYPWGDKWDTEPRCNYADSSLGLKPDAVLELFRSKGWTWDRTHDDGFPFTSPVHELPLGASEYGAHDMAGNVLQWCLDAFERGYYARYVTGDRSPQRGDLRAVRGGCWLYPQFCCRSSFRTWGTPNQSSEIIGFRVVVRTR